MLLLNGFLWRLENMLMRWVVRLLFFAVVILLAEAFTNLVVDTGFIVLALIVIAFVLNGFSSFIETLAQRAYGYAVLLLIFCIGLSVSNFGNITVVSVTGPPSFEVPSVDDFTDGLVNIFNGSNTGIEACPVGTLETAQLSTVESANGVNGRSCASSDCTREDYFPLGEPLIVLDTVEGEFVSATNNVWYEICDRQRLLYVYSGLVSEPSAYTNNETNANDTTETSEPTLVDIEPTDNPDLPPLAEPIDIALPSGAVTTAGTWSRITFDETSFLTNDSNDDTTALSVDGAMGQRIIITFLGGASYGSFDVFVNDALFDTVNAPAVESAFTYEITLPANPWELRIVPQAGNQVAISNIRIE